MYRARMLAGKLARLVSEFPVVVLAGARQVGKSTLVARALPDWSSVTLDPAVDVGGARADPDLFLDNHPAPLVLDEIQFAPELVPAIKRRVDRTQAPKQFILTGSQQWSVLRTASESLAGRAAFLDLEGLSLHEFASDPIDGPDPCRDSVDHWLARYLDDPDLFVTQPVDRLQLAGTLYERLWRGFLPTADRLPLNMVPDFHRGYLRTYLERDARVVADVADWQQFGRFVRLASALTAQEINYSQLGREIGLTPNTARRWLATLQATFQWFELPAFHSNATKRVSLRPKGHIADTGMACAAQMISTPNALAGHPMVGAIFESAVISEIRKLAATLATPPALHHWRSHGGAEVDLILERDGRIFPIEIKLTSNPGRADARGIHLLRDSFPDARISAGLVIAPIDSSRRIQPGILAMPWDAE